MTFIKKRTTIALGVLLLVVIGAIGAMQLTAHQKNEQRFEVQQQEMVRQQEAISVAMTVQGGFFTYQKDNKRFGLKELLATAGNKLDDNLRLRLLKNSELDGLYLVNGCRLSYAPIIFTQGLTYGTASKKTNDIYKVLVTFGPGEENPKDRKSKGFVEVNVKNKKITNFDCREQQVIDAQREQNADTERKGIN